MLFTSFDEMCVISLEWIRRNGTAGSESRCTFHFLKENAGLFPKVVISFILPTTTCKSFGCSASLQTFGGIDLFNCGNSSKLVLVAHGVLLCISLMTNTVKHFLLCSTANNSCSCILFYEGAHQIFCPFLEDCFFYWVVVVHIFCKPVLRYRFSNFLKKLNLPSCFLNAVFWWEVFIWI